jgi:hypothetical protein
MGNLTDCQHGFHSVCSLVTIKCMRAGNLDMTCYAEGCGTSVVIPDDAVVDAITEDAKKEFAFLEKEFDVESMSFDNYLENLTQAYCKQGTTVTTVRPCPMTPPGRSRRSEASMKTWSHSTTRRCLPSISSNHGM